MESYGNAVLMMNCLGQKFSRAVRRHGIIGIFGVISKNIISVITSLRPSVQSEIRERKQREMEFDQRFGVDTAGCIHQTELNINNPNQLHAVSYGGSDPKEFMDAMNKLPIDYRNFVFLDFGSGKGRAILLAMKFPFKKIVGIEFSEELHEIAQRNIKSFKGNVNGCQNVELVCMDVIDYSLPCDCLVCYFCNPFNETIMAPVLSNIQKTFLQNSREIFIVYYNPREGHLINQMDCFKLVGTTKVISIWKTTLESNKSN